MTLSIDLRERILGYVLKGNSRRKAAEKFAVSASSAVRIAARYAATGSVVPKTGKRGRRSKLEAHRDYLVRRIAEAPDITMPERLSVQKKPCWPASKIGLTSGRRGRHGATVSARCGFSRTGSSSSTKPEPPPR